MLTHLINYLRYMIPTITSLMGRILLLWTGETYFNNKQARVSSIHFNRTTKLTRKNYRVVAPQLNVTCWWKTRTVNRYQTLLESSPSLLRKWQYLILLVLQRFGCWLAICIWFGFSFLRDFGKNSRLFFEFWKMWSVLCWLLVIIVSTKGYPASLVETLTADREFKVFPPVIN